MQVGLETFEPEPDPAGLRLPVRDYRSVPGRIEISSPGREPARPEDELVPLVMNLCFRAVSQLSASPHATVGYTDTYGYLRLDLEGAWIRLSGDRVPDVRLPGRALLEALVACGTRFIAWLPRLNLSGDVDAICGALSETEREARAALDTGLLRG